MPVIDGRLTCCTCGSDLGDADDPYRDPSCVECLRREMEDERETETVGCVVCDAPAVYSDFRDGREVYLCETHNVGDVR